MTVLNTILTALNTILQLLFTFIGALVVFRWELFKTKTEATVKTIAEETAKETVQELKWPGELARELQKTRGVERQELRYKSYGALWKELRLLAIYDSKSINKTVVGELSAKLTDWYFSECGGLLLTPQARDFYFALQDLLHATSLLPEDWDAERIRESEEAKHKFERVLGMREASQAIDVLTYLSKDDLEHWHQDARGYGEKWRKGIKNVAAAWTALDNRERFATLQQVGSALRTCLVNDLESRVR